MQPRIQIRASNLPFFSLDHERLGSPVGIIQSKVLCTLNDTILIILIIYFSYYVIAF